MIFRTLSVSRSAKILPVPFIHRLCVYGRRMNGRIVLGPVTSGILDIHS
jgi:hypothetical protein